MYMKLHDIKNNIVRRISLVCLVYLNYQLFKSAYNQEVYEL